MKEDTASLISELKSQEKEICDSIGDLENELREVQSQRVSLEYGVKVGDILVVKCGHLVGGSFTTTTVRVIGHDAGMWVVGVIIKKDGSGSKNRKNIYDKEDILSINGVART